MPRRKFNLLHLLLLTLVPTGTDAAGTPVPVGGEFQVNTYTGFYQGLPAVAVDGRGNFVVVWDSVACSAPGPCERPPFSGSNGWDTSETAIHAQRFDPAGAPLGSEFQVNTFGEYWQFAPEVAADTGGNFVVVWESHGSNGSDSDYTSVQGQRFDSAGAPVGPEFQVNTLTTGYQLWLALAVDGGGSFVVVWDSWSDIQSYGIRGQRFDSAGVPLGGEFQVITDLQVNAHGGDPAVAVDGDGDFVVVWRSFEWNGSDPDTLIRGQRFNSAGAPVGSEFQINTYTTGRQRGPAVAADAGGSFVVVWQGVASVQGQRFDSVGAPAGGEFQVSTSPPDAEHPFSSPAVAVDGGGNFVVVWPSSGSNGSDSSDTSIQGQRFDSAGAPDGAEFQVNTYTTSFQGVPAVSAAGDGDFVVVWESSGSSGSDTSRHSIQGQRFAIPLFADGFESGDTSAWSNSVPLPSRPWE